MKKKEEPLLIKRYSSRRLYNTETSEYTTLDDVAKIIRTGRDIRVIDRENGEDLTREYLVRIIINNESIGLPVLPVDILANMVRSYKEDSLAVIPKFLEATYSVLNQSQSQFLKNVSDPVKGFMEIQKSQQEYFSRMFPFWSPIQNPSSEESSAAKPASEEPELDRLRKQMADLQKSIDELESQG